MCVCSWSIALETFDGRIEEVSEEYEILLYASGPMHALDLAAAARYPLNWKGGGNLKLWAETQYSAVEAEQ